jgi:hypothetical protein
VLRYQWNGILGFKLYLILTVLKNLRKNAKKKNSSLFARHITINNKQKGGKFTSIDSLPQNIMQLNKKPGTYFIEN